MTDLAQRLNELALANSNGFLNDDEYRLLRHNAFEEYSANVVVPAEAPVVPITACVDVHVQLHTPVNAVPNLPETPKPIPSPGRPKSAITSGVTSLLSKASGRRTPKLARDSPTLTSPREGRTFSKSSIPSIPGRESPSGSLKLSVMIPKLLQKKPTYFRTPETPRPLTDALKASRTIRTSKISPLHLSTATPTGSLLTAANKSTASLRLDIPKEPHSPVSLSPAPSIRNKDIDVFSDDNLSTSTHIRNAITKTEDEFYTLTDAFVSLEARTRRRVQKQKAHRLPANTPASVDILLEGREWREHRRIPLTGPRLDSGHRHFFTSTTQDSIASEATSLRSASSHKTSLSQARSISSIPRNSHSPSRSTPGPVNASSVLLRGNTIKSTPRKDSVSSMATSMSSSKSTNRKDSLHPPGATGNLQLSSPTHTLSRSRSQLGLKSLKQSSRMFSEETLLSISSSSAEENNNESNPNRDNSVQRGELEIEDDPELLDIRQRQEELVARYNARLEFLRAKLKSAELHERLLKK